MAYINISMKELASLIRANGNYDKNRIKDIKIVNENQFEIIVSLGQFFPDIRVCLVYNSFQQGKIIFNVITSGGVKMLIGLMNEMGGAQKDFISMDRNNISIDINKLLSANLKGVTAKDINQIGGQLYITLSIL